MYMKVKTSRLPQNIAESRKRPARIKAGLCVRAVPEWIDPAFKIGVSTGLLGIAGGIVNNGLSVMNRVEKLESDVNQKFEKVIKGIAELNVTVKKYLEKTEQVEKDVAEIKGGG